MQTNLSQNRIDVWVVEDNEEYRRVLAEVIDNAGDMICSQAFANCEDAVAALEAEAPPQVLLMDIGLPGMSGIEGVPLVKAISPATAIIMLTVYEDDDKVFQSICAGALGYVLKKATAERIIESIREANEGGAPMSAAIARRVLEMFAKTAAPPGQYGLTVREKDILQHVVDGLSPKMIAGALHLSLHTVTTHIKNIFAKLHVHSRSEAVAKALRERLI
jgi:DNA-binding NarL/FixJ family response regulator